MGLTVRFLGRLVRRVFGWFHPPLRGCGAQGSPLDGGRAPRPGRWRRFVGTFLRRLLGFVRRLLGFVREVVGPFFRRFVGRPVRRLVRQVERFLGQVLGWIAGQVVGWFVRLAVRGRALEFRRGSAALAAATLRLRTR
ncbi:hypothetical protein AB0O34_35775 [Sphaerisporangium sp. NPDC088356]|uniref:hypothetical protein n=1 Tax=Sphaerisporangium sp. NPDC088356 TaxID=3154871 RepID=UPI003447EBA2